MRRASRAVAGWITGVHCPGSPSFFIFRQLPATQHQPATQHHAHERLFSSGSKSDLWAQSVAVSGVTGDLRTLHPVVGQPSHYTHPELLSAGELTPGILAAEYAARRRHLMECLPQGAVVVLPSASIMYMSGVIPYPYRQDPDFFYLTGLMQRGVLLLQSDTRKAGGHSFTLFIDAPNPERARWDGATVDADAAMQEFGADHVYHMTQLPNILSAAARKASEVFFDVDRTGAHSHSAVQRLLQAALPPAATTTPSGLAQQGAHTAPAGATSTSKATHATQRLIPLRQLLHAMRLRKSSSEIALMRASAQLAATALTRCIQQTRPGVAEYSLAATFEYECKLRGASRMAYPQVVAAGSDATTIHYGRNDKVLRAGQLLLMDAGCELHGYCSDVTRTWPVSGRFSSPQRDVYDLVLSVHARCVAACRPGSTLRELHQLSCDLISEGLHSLGVCRGATLGEIQCGLYRRFYWHSVGHWLGLDTHDTPRMAHERVLQPGHVITIEPGLYIPDEDKYGALRGIGVRIEDDVLVTPTGCEVLSAGVPHRRAEVEALVGSAWK